MKTAFAYLHGQSPQGWHVRVEVGPPFPPARLLLQLQSLSFLWFREAFHAVLSLASAWTTALHTVMHHAALGRLSWGQPGSFEAPYFLCHDSLLCLCPHWKFQSEFLCHLPGYVMSL